MGKNFIKIFLELKYYVLSLMFMSGLLLAIDFGFFRNPLLFEKYNLFGLSLDMLSAWFAIYILLPWFAQQKDFFPEVWQKFEAVFYVIIFLHQFWLTGPWGLGR